VAKRLVGETGAGREREPLAVEAASVAREQPSNDFDGLTQARQRALLRETELIEPRSGDEAEVCPSA